MITPNSAAQAYRLDGEDKKLHFAKLLRGTLLKEKINGQLCLRKQDATITFFLNVTLQWQKSSVKSVSYLLVLTLLHSLPTCF